MSCHWGILGHIWVQTCTNIHCLVVGYTLVVVGISYALDNIQSVTAILSTRCSPSLISYSREGVFALKEWLLWNPPLSDCNLFSSAVTEQWNVLEISMVLPCPSVFSCHSQWFSFIFQQWFKTDRQTTQRVYPLIPMLSAFDSSIQIKESTLSHRFSITDKLMIYHIGVGTMTDARIRIVNESFVIKDEI